MKTIGRRDFLAMTLAGSSIALLGTGINAGESTTSKKATEMVYPDLANAGSSFSFAVIMTGQ